jgi:hypothetical protein
VGALLCIVRKAPPSKAHLVLAALRLLDKLIRNPELMAVACKHLALSDEVNALLHCLVTCPWHTEWAPRFLRTGMRTGMRSESDSCSTHSSTL